MRSDKEDASENQFRCFKKYLTAIFLVCTIVIAAIGLLSGEQLLYRNSPYNLDAREASGGVVELTRDNVVEQVFFTNIQYLDSVSVQWGTFYRPDFGTITMELYRDGILLGRQQFYAEEVPDGGFLKLELSPAAETAGESMCLRLTSTSLTGSALCPLEDVYGWKSGFSLSLNGEAVPGILCFTASGREKIWFGNHYWTFAGLTAFVLATALWMAWRRAQKGRGGLLWRMTGELQKYRFLIQQLILRDFRTKYKRSFLGILWSALNPLLMMLVQYFVFSHIFDRDVEQFGEYLLVGVVMFNFFSESCGMTLLSILGNAPLITKVYMPRYIYPLTRTLSSVVNLAISFIPLFFVGLVTGLRFHKTTVLSLYFFACLVIFVLGLGMMLSASMVFFRDTQFLWSVASLMWMYATPIFYPESILPESYRFVLQINPLYHFMKSARMCIIDGLSPEPGAYGICLMIAAGMLIVGMAVFHWTEDRFVLYL